VAEEKAKKKKEKAEGKPEGKAEKAKGKAEKAAAAEGTEKGKPSREPRPNTPSELEIRFKKECVPALMEQFGYKNVMRVPHLEKIVLNTSVKEALQDIKVLENAAEELAQITGQRPCITKAKKSIANFKLRKGQSIGARVTLRGKTMYDFMNKLVNVALPRVRDFKGVSSRAFDGRGNYTLGLTEQAIFPEINVDRMHRVNGMNLTFVTSAKNDEEGKALLTLLGMPFRSE